MIGVLIIGLGNIGSEYNNKNNKHYKISHLKAIQCSKNFKILGLVDKDLNKLNKYKKIYNIYNNIEKALIELKPSLVIISVNIKNHFKILKKLSKYKNIKFVLCEKPFTENINEAKKVEKFFLNKKINIYINYMRNSDFILSSALRKYILKKKEKNIFCTIYYNSSILNGASHYICLMNKFFGKFKNIKLLGYSKNSLIFMISYFKNNVLFISNDKANSNFEKVEFKNSNFILSYLNGGYDIEIKKRIQNDVYNKKNYFKTVKKIKNPFYFNSQKYVLDEISKKFKNKKTNLCSMKEAIEVHSIISKLHNEINVKKKI